MGTNKYTNIYTVHPLIKPQAFAAQSKVSQSPANAVTSQTKRSREDEDSGDPVTMETVTTASTTMETEEGTFAMVTEIEL